MGWQYEMIKQSLKGYTSYNVEYFIVPFLCVSLWTHKFNVFTINWHLYSSLDVEIVNTFFIGRPFMATFDVIPLTLEMYLSL